MDIYCTRCGEPWDTDSFHDVDGMSWDAAIGAFRRQGCAVFGIKCERVTSARATASAALLDLMPDDIDGVASMLDDCDAMGWL